MIEGPSRATEGVASWSDTRPVSGMRSCRISKRSANAKRPVNSHKSGVGCAASVLQLHPQDLDLLCRELSDLGTSKRMPLAKRMEATAVAALLQARRLAE